LFDLDHIVAGMGQCPSQLRDRLHKNVGDEVTVAVDVVIGVVEIDVK